MHRSQALLCMAQPCREIVKRIDMWGIDMLFVVGGNGGNAGANAIQVSFPVITWDKHRDWQNSNAAGLYPATGRIDRWGCQEKGKMVLVPAERQCTSVLRYCDKSWPDGAVLLLPADHAVCAEVLHCVTDNNAFSYFWLC
eukprot:scaffold35170_cov20-Tisochrysis_lutea.AAC.1